MKQEQHTIFYNEVNYKEGNLSTADISELKESSTVEFKEKVNDNFFKSLSAFANTEGGRILLGIKDDKTPVGFNGHQESLINQIIESLGI